MPIFNRGEDIETRLFLTPLLFTTLSVLLCMSCGDVNEVDNKNSTVSLIDLDKDTLFKENIEADQLSIEAEYKSVKYLLSYLPPSFYAEQILSKSDIKVTDKSRDSMLKHLGNNEHFILNIFPDREAMEKLDAFLSRNDNAASNYLNFGISKDIYLYSSKDTLYPQMLHFENTYRSSGKLTYNLLFERDEKVSINDYQLLFSDSIFNKKKIAFGLINLKFN